MDTKDEIMNVTFILFSEKGYNVSMADIAKQVGIKVPSIYSHFESKDEIICLVMTKEIKNFFDNLYNQISILDKADETSEMKLKTICFSVFTYFSKPERIRFWKSISLIYNNQLRTECRDLIKENLMKIAILLNDIFVEGRSKGQIKFEYLDGAVYLFMAMVNGVLDSILIYNDISVSLDNYKKKIWQSYWDGIKA